jgi:hypothetical protein
MTKSNRKTDVRMTVMEDLVALSISNTIVQSIFYEDIYWDRYFVPSHMGASLEL